MNEIYIVIIHLSVSLNKLNIIVINLRVLFFLLYFSRPDHLQENFLFPDLPSNTTPKTISPKNIVRVGGSFDMGWPTKGSGRSYDSLSGTGGYIGYFSKKVMAQVILNRKCRMCDLGHPKSDHDCKSNFSGSAKAMEPEAARLLVSDCQKILSEVNVQIGLFIGDCDSTAIAAARNEVDYEIPKQDDKNHTSKGVTSQLYKHVKSHKELNSKSITYLGKCLNYCVSQNKEDAKKMAVAIRNIPHHCFNNHSDCGDWCHYSKDPSSYKHSVIGDGFKDPKLFDTLQSIYNNLADKTDQFCGGVSSNPNESFQAMVASKAPKSQFYGTSQSYNLRVNLAVLKKNEGENFIVKLLENCNMSPTKKLKKYCDKIDKYSSVRYSKANTVKFKKRRLLLKKQKAELRYKNKLSEGTTYESNISLMNNECDSIKLACVDENTDLIVVFFDLETGSTHGDCDILQIAVKYKEYEFNIYIKPTQKISDKASQVNGLTFANGNLKLYGKIVSTVNLQEALVSLYQFLCKFKNKCVLTAHNCSFDYPRLVKAIEKTYLDKYFQSIVYGFSDTLPIIRSVTGVKTAGSNTLENLANNLKIQGFQAHDAVGDVAMLEQIVLKLEISETQIIQSSFTWNSAKEKILLSKKISLNLKLYDELKDCTSKETKKKLIAANISVDEIIDKYKENGFNGISNLFGADENGLIRITKSKKVINKLIDYLKTKY